MRVQYREGGRDFEAEAIHKAASLINKKTGLDPHNLKIAKKSIDARRDISFVYSVYAEIEADKNFKASGEIKLFSEPELVLDKGNKKLEYRPVVVGFGPAGMFAALILAENGYAPIVLERGASVEERVRAVDRFIQDGILDTNTNIQFGAGGAGTFSDGKLTTRINDPLIAYVLKTLCELGAPEDIIYKAKPHIGTDILRLVVDNADKRITELGGEIRYKTTAENITSNKLTADGDVIPFDALVLATGHSARDTYSQLIGAGFAVEAKPFSVGVRAEHLQDDIDKAMFKSHAGDKALGHAEYQLSYRKGERGCYTFCMCPGGVVVPSASEEFGVVTNGMSTRARDGRNANAAVCVSVLPKDYGSDPVSSIEFQRDLERKAFVMGGRDYTAPMQTVGDLLNGKSGASYSKVVPTYRDGKVTPVDFSELFPPFVTEMLREGISDFGRKIRGYSDDYVPLTGVETRTSAPVRILRGDDCTAVGYECIYPCGEGAGYAGGIVSAAVDGIRVAAKIIGKYSPKL
ncbi:MAG: hypothetical protein E7672_00885 [Ruminococcaceae bacterium]|nr:hypothetical protein [Oscillospiraceae bacterium]